MNLSHLQTKLGRVILASSLLFGIGMASSVTTHAQYQDDYWHQQRRIEREQQRRQRQYQREQIRRQRQAGRYDNYGYGNNGYGYGNNGYGVSNQIAQTALNAGYNEGIKEGRNDRNRGRGFDYADSSTYRNASKDYNSRYGNPDVYRQYFRQGFVNGYTDGYRGY